MIKKIAISTLLIILLAACSSTSDIKRSIATSNAEDSYATLSEVKVTVPDECRDLSKGKWNEDYDNCLSLMIRSNDLLNTISSKSFKGLCNRYDDFSEDEKLTSIFNFIKAKASAESGLLSDSIYKETREKEHIGLFMISAQDKETLDCFKNAKELLEPSVNFACYFEILKGNLYITGNVDGIGSARATDLQKEERVKFRKIKTGYSPQGRALAKKYFVKESPECN